MVSWREKKDYSLLQLLQCLLQPWKGCTCSISSVRRKYVTSRVQQLKKGRSAWLFQGRNDSLVIGFSNGSQLEHVKNICYIPHAHSFKLSQLDKTPWTKNFEAPWDSWPSSKSQQKVRYASRSPQFVQTVTNPCPLRSKAHTHKKHWTSGGLLKNRQTTPLMLLILKGLSKKQQPSSFCMACVYLC